MTASGDFYAGADVQVTDCFHVLEDPQALFHPRGRASQSPPLAVTRPWNSFAPGQPRPDMTAMTFTIAARCKRTGETGLAMATVSLAIGGLCPWFTSNGNVISSQAYASKRDGQLMYRAMEEGKGALVALAVLKARDPDVEYRQLLILPRHGDPVAFTGEKCRP